MPVSVYPLISPELVLLLPLLAALSVHIRRICFWGLAGRVLFYFGAGMLGFAVSLAYSFLYDLPSLAAALARSLVQGGAFGWLVSQKML